MKEIPSGFKKMDLILTFDNNQVKTVENTIIFFIVRDYYFFYTKLPKFDGKKWTEFHFYCRPADEVSIAYRFGCYAQACFRFYNGKQYFQKHGGHTVAKPFPKSYHIDAHEDEHNLGQKKVEQPDGSNHPVRYFI